MKTPSASSKIALVLSYIVAIILVLLPFHALITVWLSSLLGHYTLLRLWKEFLVVLVVVGAVYCLLSQKALLTRFFLLKLTQLILIYILLLTLLAFIPLAKHDVTAKAMWYGLLVDLRFLVFFLAVMVLATKSKLLQQNWQKILFAPAILVGAFAILQYLFLPYDFLKHFGYGPSTISPYETINHNIHHIRVASTLRGANPLGAYLVVPICALAVAFLKDRTQKPNKVMFSFGLVLALVFSFSRSAWIGTALGVLVGAWFYLGSKLYKKIVAWTLAGLLVVAGLAVLTLRNNTTFEDIFLHTEHGSKTTTSSNEGHAAAFKGAIKEIIHKPFGQGVGTAGPQSIYNNNQGRIAENYFLQIGQEAGILGMVLFIAICLGVGKSLYDRRSDQLALALLASLIGISFVNLLSHAWADDTLAYIWWGLAGIALAPVILVDRHKQNGKTK